MFGQLSSDNVNERKKKPAKNFDSVQLKDGTPPGLKSRVQLAKN